MLSVELDGTLGVVGLKSEFVFCFVCSSKNCNHVAAVNSKQNSEMPAIKEFLSAASIPQPQYRRKCLSTNKIPFFSNDEYGPKIQAAPHDYLTQDTDGMSMVGGEWVCPCGAGTEEILCHEVEPLFSRDYLIYIHG